MEERAVAAGRCVGRLRRWELALLLGTAIAALLGVWLDGVQSGLADKVVRLHVIANSDSEADQALKLQVRDAVLARAEGLVDAGADMEQVQGVLGGSLEQLARAGAQVVAREGYSYSVTASLEQDVWFPTKQYTDFSFPAGRYTALRIVIGEGRGRNWWCVVFPPLCLGSVTETVADRALEGGLTDREVALITGEDEGYVVKFKAVELWERLKAWSGRA